MQIVIKTEIKIHNWLTSTVPGSGNTWVRHLLQLATGKRTGSISSKVGHEQFKRASDESISLWKEEILKKFQRFKMFPMYPKQKSRIRDTLLKSSRKCLFSNFFVNFSTYFKCIFLILSYFSNISSQ